MRITLLAVIMMFALPNLGLAQSSGFLRMEYQAALDKTEVVENASTVTLNLQKNRFLGFIATYGRSDSPHESWGETTFGLSFRFSDRFIVSLGPGIEDHGGAVRGRLNLDYKNEENHNFCYAEYDVGKADSWYWFDCTFFPVSRLGIGLLGQMPDLGLGPKLDIRLGDKISLSTAGLYNPNDSRFYATIGVRALFHWKE